MANEALRRIWAHDLFSGAMFRQNWVALGVGRRMAGQTICRLNRAHSVRLLFSHSIRNSCRTTKRSTGKVVDFFGCSSAVLFPSLESSAHRDEDYAEKSPDVIAVGTLVEVKDPKALRARSDVSVNCQCRDQSIVVQRILMQPMRPGSFVQIWSMALIPRTRILDLANAFCRER